jgi:hypothetical protein
LAAILACCFVNLPLVVSLTSLSAASIWSKAAFADLIGLSNYRKLLFGSEKTHLLGLWAEHVWHWLIFGLVVAALAVFWRDMCE